MVAWDDVHGYSWILDSALCIPDSLSVKLEFRNQIVSGISKVCFLLFLFFLIGLSYVFVDAVVGGSKPDERFGPFYLNF